MLQGNETGMYYIRQRTGEAFMVETAESRALEDK